MNAALYRTDSTPILRADEPVQYLEAFAPKHVKHNSKKSTSLLYHFYKEFLGSTRQNNCCKNHANAQSSKHANVEHQDEKFVRILRKSSVMFSE